eukprot:3102039-Amphidinium_carterae.2
MAGFAGAVAEEPLGLGADSAMAEAEAAFAAAAAAAAAAAYQEAGKASALIALAVKSLRSKG